MAASFILYKYTGKDCIFGTPVTSLGLKRIDACVPAVYGVPIVPAADATDVNTYCIYRPEVDNEEIFSFETIWKMVLTVPPDHQVSNVRIWPDLASLPNPPQLPAHNPPQIPPPYMAEYTIGESISYSRPTNIQSHVAVNDIYQYTRENPFYVTVNGNFGQHTNLTVNVINYIATLHDVGYGNIIYMNNVMQENFTISVKTNIALPDPVYQILNQATGFLALRIFDPILGNVIVHPDIVYSISSGGKELITITATNALMMAYPSGFVYAELTQYPPPCTFGTFCQHISWLDLSADPIELISYTVEVRYNPDGIPVYYLNGIENPVLNFQTNTLYEFINISGATDPLRFLNNPNAVQASNPNEVVIIGVTVYDGATANERIIVDPATVMLSGVCIRSYQSVHHACFGNGVTSINTGLVGNYNINTVGGGVANPMAAGETDFIYLQMGANNKTLPGSQLPNLVIEWDES